jgi:hypothetical protein
LGGSGSDGIGRLAGISPLDSSAALCAIAHMDVKARDSSLTHDLGLVLFLHAQILDLAAATGAAAGQRNYDFVVHVERNGSASLLAILDSRLTAGTFRIGFGFALGERGRLTLRSPSCKVEFVFQVIAFFFQTPPLTFQALALMPQSLNLTLEPGSFFGALVLQSFVFAFEPFLFTMQLRVLVLKFFDFLTCAQAGHSHPAHHNRMEKICPEKKALTR